MARYAAHIAAQLGAHIIKVKLPMAHIERDAARKVYDERRIPIATPAERVRHVVDCVFAGRRIVIFSGGATVFDDDKLLDEIRSIHAGGGEWLYRAHAVAVQNSCRPCGNTGGWKMAVKLGPLSPFPAKNPL